MEFATTVVLVGLTIVFLALVGLTLFFILWGKAMSGTQKSNSTPPVAPKAASQNTAPVVEQGIGDDVIAAISAAVACMLGDGDAGYTVRSIKRAAHPRKEWRMAGMLQNTRSF